MRRLILLFVLTGTVTASAQKLPGDSLLANERSIDRPITVHDGQLRITGHYGFAEVSRAFDAYAEPVSLPNVTSAVAHRFSLDVKYGLTEFVQFSAALARTQQVVREETIYIDPQDSDPVIAHEVINDHSGFEDLYIGFDLRAPLKTRRVDLMLIVGAHLPTSRFDAQQPDHSFRTSGTESEPVHHFTYRYKYARGRGITVARIGGMTKYRSRQWAISGRVDYEHGLVDGSGIEWRHQFEPGSGFEYRSIPYTFRLPDLFVYFMEVEYQARPSLDLFINCSGWTAFRGWMSSIDDLKVAIPYRTVLVCSPGAEVLLTPRLWVRGRANIAVTGKNTEAPLGVEATVMYNIFPF